MPSSTRTGDAIRIPAPIEGTITEIEPAQDDKPPLLMLTTPAREIDPAMLRFYDEVKKIGRQAAFLGPVVSADEGSVTVDLLPAAHPLRRR